MTKDGFAVFSEKDWDDDDTEKGEDPTPGEDEKDPEEDLDEEEE